MSELDKLNYDNLLGFKPAWLSDIRGFREHRQMLTSFREQLHSHHEWDEPSTEPVSGTSRGALAIHDLGRSPEDNYSEESMP